MPRLRYLSVLLLLLLSPVLLAVAPSWWSEPSTRILEEEGEENNYAPANLGQLKHVAKMAKAHLDETLADGSGSAITTLVDNFEPRSGQGYTQPQIDAFLAENYAPINLGQLKAVAKPFYDRLLNVGYDTKANLIAHGLPSNWVYDYPWHPETLVEENYAPANLGQLKLVFSFDLNGFDTDLDGLPDMWEYDYIGDIEFDGSDDLDLDGLTNLEEFQQGGDPLYYYSRGSVLITPELEILSGNSQEGPLGQYLNGALVIRVTDSVTGEPLENAPVSFGSTRGTVKLATIKGLANATTWVEPRTGADGIVKVYAKPEAGTVSEVTASAWPGSSVYFSINPPGLPVDGLQVWLKADEGVTRQGNAVVTWQDQSGYNRNAQQTNLQYRPNWVASSLNGKASVKFDGVDDFLSGYAGLNGGTSNLTIIGVHRRPGSTYWGAPVSMAAGQHGAPILGWRNSTWELGINDVGRSETGTYVNSGSNSQGKYLLSSVSRAGGTSGNGGTLSVRSYDGQTQLNASGTQTWNSTSTSSYYLGRHWSPDTGTFLRGEVAEVLIYSRALTETEQTHVETYLKDKYGLEDSDGDGMQDGWEVRYGLSSSNPSDAVADADGDGLTNLQEMRQGTDPTDEYDGSTRTLAIDSGNNQSGSGYLSNPLTVKVSGTGGVGIEDAMVTFRVTAGPAEIATTNPGDLEEELEVQTDSSGLAHVYLNVTGTSVITVQALAGTKAVDFVANAPTSGMKLWLRADAGVVKGSNGGVSQWTDQSGNGMSASNGGLTTQPLLIEDGLHGQPSVRFDGVDDVLSGTSNYNSSSSDYTILTVHRRSAVSNWSAPFSFSTSTAAYGAPLLTWKGTGPELGVNDVGRSDTGVYVSNTMGADRYSVTSLTRSGGTNGQNGILSLKANSGPVTLTSSGTQTWVSGTSTGFQLAKHYVAGPSFLKGDVAEVIVYNRVLTAGELALMEDYLKQKYALRDSDTDGMADWWEEQNGLSPSDDADDTLDADSDGLNNLQEFQQGSDPRNYYSRGDSVITPVISIDSGNNQSGLIDRYLPQPLVVKVTTGTANNALVNAPVTFKVAHGDGALAVQRGSDLGQTVMVQTGPTGLAKVFYRQGTEKDVGNAITATTGTASVTFQTMTLDETELVGRWKFDEGSGTTIADDSGLGNSGTLSGNGPTFATSLSTESALEFDGTGNDSAYVNGGTNASRLNFGAGSFSLSCWFKSDLANYGRLVGKGAWFNSEGYALRLSSDTSGQFGKLNFMISSSTGTEPPMAYPGALHLTTLEAFNDNKWHHVAVVVNREGGSVKVYVDGEPREFDPGVSSGTGLVLNSGVAAADISAMNDLHATAVEEMGFGQYGGVGNPYDGLLDEVSVYARALSEEEIVALGDIDDDGMPDWWEWENFGGTNAVSSGDADGDGLSNLQEYEQESDPNNYYRQGSATVTPVIAIKGGNNQASPPQTYLTQPFAVEVRSGSATGTLLNNAPISFTVTSGSGGLATQFGGTTTISTLNVVSGTNGRAQAYYKQGAGEATSSTITAQTGTTSTQFVSKTSKVSGLWAHWAFDEGNGTVAGEKTGLSVTGTLANQATWSQGFDGKGGLLLNGSPIVGGTGAYVTMGSPSDRGLDFDQGSFSVSLWVKYTDGENPPGTYGRRILSKGHHGWNPGYLIAVHNGGKVSAGLGPTVPSAPNGTLVQTTENFNDGRWHHVAVTWDWVNKKARIYVDGIARELEKDPSNTGGTISGQNSIELDFSGLGNLTATREDIPLTIGSHLQYDFYRGEVDDVRIYRKTLTPTEVEELYHVDSDPNGLPDNWEWENFGSLGIDPNGNGDDDALSNIDEYLNGTKPGDWDSDDDGMGDGWEVANGLDPLADDAGENPDGDGYSNLQEYKYGLDPSIADSQVQVAGGVEHSLILKADGTVWVCGTNLYGQLGDGTITTREKPVKVASLTEVASIAAGEYHSLAVKRDGTVWAWGRNNYGQLGDGTTAQRNTPVQISGLSGIVAVQAGISHSLALSGTGSIHAWGRNVFGQLGDGTTTQRTSPVTLTGVSGVTEISAGANHGMALKGDGTVWAWGYNNFGRLGDGTTTQRNSPVQTSVLSDVIAICAGGTHNLALKSDGTVWAWGNNDGGRLGDGTTASERLSPVQVSSLTEVSKIAAGSAQSMAVKADGTLWMWGDNTLGTVGDGAEDGTSVPKQVTDWANVLAIGGSKNGLAMREDGSVWTWGRTDAKNLGDGTHAWRSHPAEINNSARANRVSMRHNHGLLLHSGTLLNWGRNEYGGLGDGSREQSPILQIVDDINDVAGVSAGTSHSLIVKNDGTVWAWGYNGFGNLGDGTTTDRTAAVQTSGLTGVTAVSAGRSHSLALRNTGTAYGWGRNNLGQLGDSTTTHRSVPVVISGLGGSVAKLSSGDQFNLALKTDGTVWAWGFNGQKQLGDGTTTNRTTPIQVSGLSSIAAIAAGTEHSMVIKSDGTVWSWGRNANGQLGNNSTTNAGSPVQVSGLTDIIAVAGGNAHSLAVKEDGSVWAWGDNSFGQLGDGTTTQRNTPVQVAGLTGVVEVFAGQFCSLALKADGTLCAWGANTYGQLGIGYSESIPVEVFGINGFAEAPLVSITAPSSPAIQPLAQELALSFSGSGGAGVDHVELYQEGIKLGEAEASESSITWTPATWGTFYLTVVAVDQDGVRSARSNRVEVQVPFDSDTDDLPDWWEFEHFGNVSAQSASGDADGDLISNLDELLGGTDPNSYDVVVDTPTLTPPSGTFAMGRNIVVNCATSGVTIRYTTDGREPTQDDQTVTNGGTIYVGRSLTLKVKAWDAQNRGSNVAEGIYRVTGLVAAASFSSYAIKASGELVGWGWQGSGVIANGQSAGTISTPSSSLKVSGTTTVPFMNAVSVDGGYSHGVAADADGNAWGFGANASYGEVGDNTSAARTSAVRVLKSTGTNDYLGNVVDVSAGRYHTLALDQGGKVWAWGYGGDGELGRGTESLRRYAQPVTFSGTGNPELEGIRSISAGHYHNLAITSDNKVVSWGYNSNGQLGNGNSTSQSRAVYVMSASVPLSGITGIAAGPYHSLAIRNTESESGAVYGWGNSYYGELGSGSSQTTVTNPGQVIKVDNSPLTGVIQVAAGSYNSLALDQNGNVWAWGHGVNGELGDGSSTTRYKAALVLSGSGVPLDRIVYIAAGGHHGSGYQGINLAVRDDGKVYSWGYSNNQALGQGSTEIVRYATPLAASGFEVASPNPEINVSVYEDYLVAPADVRLRAEASVSGGTITSVKFYDGTQLLGTATSAPYELVLSNRGVGSYSVRTIAYAADGGSAYADVAFEVTRPQVEVTAEEPQVAEASPEPGKFLVKVVNGKVSYPLTVSLSSGGNATSGEDYEALPTSVTIAAESDTVEVEMTPKTDENENEGDEYVALTLGVGSSYTIGSATAEIILKDSPVVGTPVFTPNGGHFVLEQNILVECPTAGAVIHYTTDGRIPTQDDSTISNGATLTISRTLTLKARAWDSQGRGSEVAEGHYNITGLVSAGAYNSFLIKSTGEMLSWGWQSGGALANNSTSASQQLTPGSTFKLSGTVPIMNAKSVDGGVYHGVMLDTEGNVWGFGADSYGEVGDGPNAAVKAVAVRVVKSSGTNDYLSGIKQADAGHYHSLAVGEDGKVWAWGYNGNGELGDGTETYRVSAQNVTFSGTGNPILTGIKEVSGGANHSLAATEDGHALSWGYNYYYQLGDGTGTTRSRAVHVLSGTVPLTGVTSVSAGRLHSLALRTSGTESGSVVSWGYNGNGELGNGTVTWSYSAVPVLKFDNSPLRNIVQISAGSAHSLALDQEGKVWAWGYNGTGALGDGTTTARTKAVPVLAGAGVPLDRIVWVSAGGNTTDYPYSMALRDDGKLFVWGVGTHGVLGNNSTNSLTYATPNSVPGATSANQKPTVTLTIDGAVSTAPADATFNAVASDADGSVTRVDFYNGGTFLGTDSSAPFNFTWQNVGAGTYTIKAIAHDNSGNQGEGSVNLTVNVPEDEILSKRFSRGPESQRLARSFVIPLDFQQGVALEPMGNNSALYPNGAPWFLQVDRPIRRHLTMSGTTPGYDLQFRNPIIAFGAEAGGSTLNIGRVYRFGINGGLEFVEDSSNPGIIYNYDPKIRVRIYDRDNLLLNSVILTVPHEHSGTRWNQFVNNGYVWPPATIPSSDSGYDTLKSYGLETHIRKVETPSSAQAWNLKHQFGNIGYSGYILSHRANNPDYRFVVEIASSGIANTSIYSFARSDSLPLPEPEVVYNTLYAMSFDAPAPWRAEVVSRPQFSGSTIPSYYVGKSVPELLNIRTTDIPLSIGSTGDYLALDTSEELRTHPALDAFVSEITGSLNATQKALAISNYVVNEVQLTDAVGLPEAVSGTSAPNLTEEAIYAPGMKRNARTTWLEGQGSPYEQCALLVYMLRKAGIPASYVFSGRNAMQMLDARLSMILGFQIRGIMDRNGDVQGDNPASSQPTLVPVNWPWVAAYVDGRWVHIFPWMKDVEIVEGFDPYQFMPPGYDNGALWLDKYLKNDSTILSLVKDDDDTPQTLFVEHLKSRLRADYSNVNIDDIGFQKRYRKTNYSSFTEFPTPFSISGTASAVAKLNSIPDLFDTIKVTVTCAQNSAKTVTTNELPLMDFFDRRMLVKFHRYYVNELYLSLVLQAFRPGLSGTGDFDAETMASRATKQVKTMTLSVPDHKNFNVDVELKMHRKFWKAFNENGGVGADPWSRYLGLQADSEQFTFHSSLQQGDLGAVVVSPGKVSERQIEPHFQELLSVQEAARQNPNSVASLDEDIYQGGIAEMVALNYFRRVGESREELGRLHKAISTHFVGAGLGQVKAERNANGTLPDGAINLVQPYVDMPFYLTGRISNETIHPDSGAPISTWNENSFEILSFANQSALEHHTLNRFFEDQGAISTVKLLRLAASGTIGIKEATEPNYTAHQTYFTGTQYSNPVETDFWNNNIKTLFVQTSGTTTTPHPDAKWTKVYLTPGQITGANGDYKGVGALAFTPSTMAAYIGANRSSGILHGGAAPSQRNYSIPSAPPAVSPPSLPSYNAKKSFDNYISFSLTSSVGTSYSYTPSTSSNVSSSGFGGFLNSTINMPFSLAGYQSSWVQSANSVLNLGLSSYNTSSSYGTALRESVNIGMVGAPNSVLASFNLVGDPVDVINGSFYLDHIDLVLSGPMPIELRRNYNSQSTALTAMGHGWKPSVVPYLVLTGDDKIYAAEADGSVIAYMQSGTTPIWRPTIAENPGLTNVRGENGIGGSNNPFNAEIVRSVESGTTVYTLTGADGSERIFRVREYPLEYAASGTNSAVTIERQRPYLDTWKDTHGNSLTFSFGEEAGTPEYGEVVRISSSNGNFLGFVYDSYRHIVQAYSGDGRRVYYSYDGQGDLKKVTLADGTEHKYEYETVAGTEVVSTGSSGTTTKQVWTSKHLLIREIKPEGRVLENIYHSDDSRRVVSQKATVAGSYVPLQNASFVYSGSANPDGSRTGATEIADALGKVTRYEYTNSLITKIKDPSPLNYEQIKEWYVDSGTSSGAYPRSLKKTVDRRGLTQEFKYDVAGNVIERKLSGDLTGDGSGDTLTSTYAYNERNLPIEIIDGTESGTAARRKVMIYSSTTYPWQPTSVTEYQGTVSINDMQYTYYDVLGTGVKACGLVQQIKVAAGTSDEAVTTFSHDANGWMISETKPTGTGDPTVVRNLNYNLRGELVQESDALGRRTNYAYDGAGNRVWTEVHDENGILASWEYKYFNRNGEVEWVDGPRYDPEDYVLTRYDGGGRPKETLAWRSEARPDGTGVSQVGGADAFAATTIYKHDAFGNMTEMVDPRRNTSTMTYDAIGRLTNRKMREGGSTGTVISQESFTYEPGGEVFEYTDPLGGVTKKYYTVGGKLRRQENPDGTVLEWRYDLYGRVVRETESNGSYSVYSYDDAGRTLVKTFKNSGGTTLATETQVQDRRGNVIFKVNAEGHESTAVYDDLDRVKLVTGPPEAPGSGRHQVEYIYDAASKVTVMRNSLHHTTTTVMDAVGRTVLVEQSDSAGSVVNRKSFEFTPDHHGVTEVSGGTTSPIRLTTYTDTQGRNLITRKADGGFRLNTYDATGNLLTATDEVGHTTTYTYDVLNRLTKTVLPGGAEITLVLDAAGNVLKRQMPGSVTHEQTFDTSSRLLAEELRNGSSVTRQFSYSYFSGGANKGLLQTVTDPRGLTSTNTYDAFMRKTSVTTSGSVPAQNTTVNYTYNLLGALNVIEQSYSGTGVGAATRVERERDGYGEIIAETVKINGTVQSEFKQTFDRARKRLSLNFTPAAQGVGAGRSYSFAHRGDGVLTKVTAGSLQNLFAYGMDGYLKSRSNSYLTHTITARDAVGRPASATVKTGPSTILSETLAWRLDGRIQDYTATRAGTSTLGVTRDFGYNARGQLVDEQSDFSSGDDTDYVYRFDGEITPDGAGLGVRTLAQRRFASSHPADLEPGSWLAQDAANPSNTPLDAFGRPVKEGPVAGSLNNYEQQAISYDAAGHQITRGLADGRTQTLTWDAFGRLVKVSQRDASNNGFDFIALYDGLGRRLRTVETPVAASVPNSSAARTIDSFFDPSVEFLEVGLAVNGQRVWKVYGPDLSGSYGEDQGIGGLLATIEESTGDTIALVTDQMANILARVDGGGVTWDTAELTGYGVAAGTSLSILEEASDLAEVVNWRSTRQDVTGLVCMGLRYYDPSSGRFLSTDSLGHTASVSLYDYASGDPINFVDPDGRFGKDAGSYFAGSSPWASFNHLANAKSIYQPPITVGEILGAVRSLAQIPASIVAGTVSNAWITFTGEDPNTRQQVSLKERAWATVNTVLDLTPAKAFTAVKTAVTSARGFSAVSDIARTVGKFDGFAAKTESVFHTVTSSRAGQGVLNGIDPAFLNPSSRFGRAFYVSNDAGTTLAELAQHGAQGTQTIRFNLNLGQANILDLTNPSIARTWGYSGGPISSATQSIGSNALGAGYNVIKYPSLRGPGINYGVLGDFDTLLKPQMIVPTP